MSKASKTDESKKPVVQDESTRPEVGLEREQSHGEVAPKQKVEAYFQRKIATDRRDLAAFQEYLNEKAKVTPASTDDPTRQTQFSRRGVLKVVAGSAIAGSAVVAAHSLVTSGSVPDQGAKHAGDRYTEAQRHSINRQLIDSRADVGGRGLGKWVALLPTKMGGGTYALDLNSNRVLASIWYWNYGDFNPISHHLCAFPSADPYHSFEFVNSTQGGMNSLIYGINTKITTPGPGFNIYRVRYDGAQMELIENVSETTGLGLGVHVTVNPKDAQSYFVTDGQKDIAACFDRNTSNVIAALKFDWEGNTKDLRQCWMQGGKLKIYKIYPDRTTGKFDYQGTKGQKLEWEMVPMGELLWRRERFPAIRRIRSAGRTAPSGTQRAAGRQRSYAFAAASAFSTRRTTSTLSPFCSSIRIHKTSIPSSASMTTTGRSSSTRFIRRGTRSGFLPMGASFA
jgi:hypothetical protein